MKRDEKNSVLLAFFTFFCAHDSRAANHSRRAHSASRAVPGAQKIARNRSVSEHQAARVPSFSRSASGTRIPPCAHLRRSNTCAQSRSSPCSRSPNGAHHHARVFSVMKTRARVPVPDFARSRPELHPSAQNIFFSCCSERRRSHDERIRGNGRKKFHCFDLSEID